MIVGPLTKHGNAASAPRLVETMDTGLLGLTASAASELRKLTAQKACLNRILDKDLDKYQDPAMDLT